MYIRIRYPYILIARRDVSSRVVEYACAEIGSGHAVLVICQLPRLWLQGGLILVSVVRVERLDEDADRIHVCLFRARKFTSLGTRR